MGKDYKKLKFTLYQSAGYPNGVVSLDGEKVSLADKDFSDGKKIDFVVIDQKLILGKPDLDPEVVKAIAEGLNQLGVHVYKIEEVKV